MTRSVLAAVGVIVAAASLAGCQEQAALLGPPAGNHRPATLADLAPARQDGPAISGVYQKLAETMPEFRVINTHLVKALDAWAEKVGVNMVVEWAALEAIGITRDTAVTLILKNVTAETVLRELLTAAAGRNVLDFAVGDNLLRVSTIDDLWSLRMRIAIYNVRDIRDAVAAWDRQREKRYEGRLPEVVYDPPRPPRWLWAFDAEHDLPRLVRAMVLPDSWMMTDAKADYLHGLLTIKQTDRGHREVARFLMMLRRALAASPYPPAMPARPRPVLNEYERMADRRLGPPATQPADGAPALSPADRQVAEQMRQRIPELRFAELPFERALDFMRDLQQVNIRPNWPSMEAIGIRKDTPISLHLKDVMFETALDEVLARAAGRARVLEWMVRDGVIKISTADDLATLQYVQIYDIRDLIAAMDRAVDRWHELKGPPPKQIRNPRTLGGGGLFAADDDEEYYDDSYDWRYIDDHTIGHLTDLLRATVAPESWTTTDARLEYIAGLLVVKQTARRHRDLAEMLTKLRAAYATAEAAEAPLPGGKK